MEEIRKFLERLNQENPTLADLAHKVDRRMLELWALAESRSEQAGGTLQGWKPLTWDEEPEEVAGLAKGSWLTRWAAALHPRASRETLETLATDPVPFIANLAQARLRTAPLPLRQPVRIVLADRDEGEFLIDGYSCENLWLEDLRHLQAEVKAGRIAKDEALAFVDSLPPDWVERRLSDLLYSEDLTDETAQLIQERGQDRALLVEYAHILPESGNPDDDYSFAGFLLSSLLNQAGVALPLPVHHGFTQDELLEWLAHSSALTGEQLYDLLSVLFEVFHSGILDGSMEFFPGGALAPVYFAGLAGSGATMILETPFPEDLKGWYGLQRILDAVWPGHYAFS